MPQWHLVGSFLSYITMHGHMNLKYIRDYILTMLRMNDLDFDIIKLSVYFP